MTRYLAGLGVAGLGLCGGGFLIVAAVATSSWHGGAGLVNLAAGGGIVLVSAVTAVAWSAAWRRRMRFDGVLDAPFPGISRRQARRHRRELARDMRRTAREARSEERAARRRARETASMPVPKLPPGVSVRVMPDAPPAVSFTDVDRAADDAPASPATGHDGASAADVIGELRALLVPLLAQAGLDRALTGPQPRLEEWKPPLSEWHPALPEWQAAPPADPAPLPPLPRRTRNPDGGPASVPRQGAGPVDSGPLRRLGEGEDTWS